MAGTDAALPGVCGGRVRRAGAVALRADRRVLFSGGAVDLAALGRFLSRAGRVHGDGLHRLLLHVGPSLPDHVRSDYGDDPDSGVAALDVVPSPAVPVLGELPRR